MAVYEYKLTTYKRDARPRSKRLRELGGSGTVGGTSIINISGAGNVISANDHSHENKNALDQISTDADGYQYLTLQKEAIDDEGNSIIEYITEKVKAGFADLAYDLSEDSPVREQFLSRLSADVAKGKITFAQGLTAIGLAGFDSGAEFGKYTSGSLGAGGAVSIDPETGESNAEFDNLYIRKRAHYRELVIEKLRHIGGQLVISPAEMECIKVEEYDGFYRCYFDTGDGEVQQMFTVGAQARCQIFTGTGQKYYWRLVAGIGTDYIDLSKTDQDGEGDIPESGDHIVQLGHRTDKDLMNAQILSSYGVDEPSFKQYDGIDSYSLEDKEVTCIAPGDNKFSGKVHIQDGSTGWENIKGLPEEFAGLTAGAVNLIRNSGFVGNYESVELEEGTELNPDSEMYSPSMEFWEGDGVAIQESESRSEYACTVNKQYLSQVLTGLMKDESYVLSFKAKGEITVSFASLSESVSSVEYERVSFRTKAASASHILHISGTGAICEIQIERGTIKSDWNSSPLDNNKTLAEFQNIKYLTDAIKNASTSIIGGLILSNIINLGNYANGQMKEITAGMSGVYNDDNDVAFWAGGNLKRAIRTVMKFVEDPTIQLSDEDWKELANVVITHGGRGIFNDVVLRGYIYALGGVFRGTIYAKDGEFTGTVNAKEGNIGNFKIKEGWLTNEDALHKSTLSSEYVSFVGYGKDVFLGINKGSYTETSYMARFVDTDTARFPAKTGIVFDISGGILHNHAFNGIGSGTLNGVIEGYASQIVTTAANRGITPGIAKGTKILCRYMESGGYIVMPTLSDAYQALGLQYDIFESKYNTPFAIRLTYICIERVYSGGICGRSTSVGDGMYNSRFIPTRWDNAEEKNGILTQSIGDVDEFMLVYDGKNTETSYRAYWLSSMH